MSTHGPIEPALHKLMNEIGHLISGAIDQSAGKGKYGFALLMFGFGPEKGRMNYISNAERETMIIALKELLARFQGFDVETPDTRQ
ncbi:MAG: hypothetical protein K2X43_01070 [Hyphomonadaceae bacterium]|jgi:hypothetical protein|nr:hypothetical protein [Hyphomonadaceae bacterium]